jgi:uncharacterized metal-binding protein
MTSTQPPKAVVVPCSGIGKTYGAVSREAAYILSEDLRPQDTQIIALSRLVLGDEAARAAVQATPVIAIDGCQLACASKMAAEAGGVVASRLAVLEVYRRYRQFKPQGIGMLNDGGIKLAEALAAEAAVLVDGLPPAQSEASHG